MFVCRNCGKELNMTFCFGCGSEPDFDDGKGSSIRMSLIKDTEGIGEIPLAASRRIIDQGGARRVSPDAVEIMSILLTQIGVKISNEAVEILDNKRRIDEYHRVTMRSEDIIEACKNLGLY